MTQPKNLLEAINYFSDEQRSLEYLAHLRWSGEPCCPKCGSTKVTKLSTRTIWKCMENGCYKQFSAKAGTVFEKSQISLGKWFIAMYLISNAKNGISSCELSRSLSVTQKTAWFMLHRIREVMRTGTFLRKLSGHVEIDETYLGGRLKFMHKNRLEKMERKNRNVINQKTVVMGMVERDGEVRAKVVDNAKHRSLLPEIEQHIEKGSNVYTDKLASYRTLSENYTHSSVDHRYSYVDGSTHTNTLENYWSCFKRTVKGTYIHIAPFHVDRYLDEQSERYNTRKMTDGQRFEFVASKVSGRRLTYSELTRAIAA